MGVGVPSWSAGYRAGARQLAACRGLGTGSPGLRLTPRRARNPLWRRWVATTACVLSSCETTAVLTPLRWPRRRDVRGPRRRQFPLAMGRGGALSPGLSVVITRSWRATRKRPGDRGIATSTPRPPCVCRSSAALRHRRPQSSPPRPSRTIVVCCACTRVDSQAVARARNSKRCDGRYSHGAEGHRRAG